MGVDLKNNFIPDATVLRKTDELLFVGRLVEKKGVSYLLEAMPYVFKKFPSIRLNIAGSGPMEKDLNQQIQRLDLSGKVTFLGMVHQSELPGLYQRATIAVFPFIIAESGDQEGFGLVQVEAMGCECPVITGDLPAIHDIVTHEVNGLIFPSGNTKALADSIIRLLADPGFRESLANEGRTRAAEMFDWDIIAQKYAGVYKQLLNNWWSV
jgi:glycosyltransferase involved in cell wall biosynthesis